MSRKILDANKVLRHKPVRFNRTLVKVGLNHKLEKCQLLCKEPEECSESPQRRALRQALERIWKRKR